jgi:hypothetical protein
MEPMTDLTHMVNAERPLNSAARVTSWLDYILMAFLAGILIWVATFGAGVAWGFLCMAFRSGAALARALTT